MKWKPLPANPDNNQIQSAYTMLLPHGISEREAKGLVQEIYEVMFEVAPEAPRGSLPKFQAKLHELIADCIDETGKSPLLSQLAMQTGRNKSTVQRALKRLVERQVIERDPYRWRGMRLLVRPGEPIPFNAQLRRVTEDAIARRKEKNASVSARRKALLPLRKAP